MKKKKQSSSIISRVNDTARFANGKVTYLFTWKMNWKKEMARGRKAIRRLYNVPGKPRKDQNPRSGSQDEQRK